MKFITYIDFDGKESVGVLSDSSKIYPLNNLGYSQKSLLEFIETTNDKDLIEIKNKILNENINYISADSVKKCAPIPVPKQDIICLGINFMAHAEESAKYKKEAFSNERPFAVYFSKRVNKAIGDGESIPSYSNIVDSLDYEAELAVVIKKDAKNISKDKVFEYIFGYTIINDISARNLQTRHKQWYLGKSLDGFTPMGPCIVTKDEFYNPPKLKISSYVNGELRQNSSTELLIFNIEHVINELSQAMTLKAGTIISMGTPAGVGMGFEPPKFLKSGDVVECRIEKIGSLKNIVQ